MCKWRRELILLKRILTMAIAKNIYTCMVGAGVFVFMYYCMRIEFIPTGLTLSDAVFFLSVITSFSIFLCFFLLCWYSISVIIFNFFMRVSLCMLKGKKDNLFFSLKKAYCMTRLRKIHEPFMGHIIISIIGVFVIFLMVTSGKISLSSVILSVMIVTISFLSISGIYTNRKLAKETKKNYVIIAIILTISLFFMHSGVPPVLSDIGMKSIGVRKSDTMALLQGKDLEMARYLTGNYHQTYFKCDVLFTGIGSTSLLVINNKKIIVNNDNMSLSF